MTESSEVLWCNVCHDKQSFLISGSGQKSICLKCGNEMTIKDRVKGVMDFIFATMSNGVDDG